MISAEASSSAGGPSQTTLPWLDPGLPRPLLPEGWAGHAARRLFHGYHELLTGPALDYFDRVFQGRPEGG